MSAWEQPSICEENGCAFVSSQLGIEGLCGHVSSKVDISVKQMHARGCSVAFHCLSELCKVVDVTSEPSDHGQVRLMLLCTC